MSIKVKIGDEWVKHSGSGSGSAKGAVLYNKKQSLDDASQAQARKNIDAASLAEAQAAVDAAQAAQAAAEAAADHSHTAIELGIYVSAEEPEGAADGAIWFDTDDNSGGAITGGAGGGIVNVAPSDWDINNNTTAGYVKNRPFWVESKYLEWDGNSTNVVMDLGDGISYTMFSETLPEIQDLVGGIISIIDNDGVVTEFNITALYKDTDIAVFEDMNINSAIIMEHEADKLYSIVSSDETQLAVICYSIDGLNDESIEVPGLYALKCEIDSDYIRFNNLKYNAICIDERYAKLFSSANGSSGTGSNIYVLDTGNSEDLSGIDFSKYKKGDIILLATSNI